MSLKLFCRSALAVGLLTLGASSVSGQITAGSEQIIGDGLAGDQTAPSLAIGPQKAYLVWQDNSVHPSGLRIRARQFDSSFVTAAAPVDASVVATRKTSGDQENPQLAVLNNGNAIMVWQGGYRGRQAIYARYLGTNGAFLTRDIKVNTYSKNYQITPSVAATADGNAVVVWASYGEDGSMLGIYGQRLTPKGGKLGREFQVNLTTAFNQRSPAVAALANGGFVVVWISELQRGPASVDVFGRTFDTNGLPTSAEFAINPTADHICANPAVVGLANGGYAVAWSQNEEQVYASAGVVANASGERSTNSWDVYGCFFDATGTPGVPAILNTYTYGDQYAPKLAAAGNTCLAVWTSLGQDGSREGIFGQFLAADGTRIGGEFGVNLTTVSRQMQPTVATDAVGNFTVIWASFRGGLAGFDLYSRSFQVNPVQ